MADLFILAVGLIVIVCIAFAFALGVLLVGISILTALVLWACNELRLGVLVRMDQFEWGGDG